MGRKALGGRGRLIVAVALMCVVGAALTVVVAGGSSRPPAGPAADCGFQGSASEVDDCYAQRYMGLLRLAPSSDAGVSRITRASRRVPGPARCHVIMHTVGQRWSRMRGLELRDLDAALPRSRDDGCASGFAHGLITALAPQIDPADPGEAVRQGCADITVRYERLHCAHGFGHAFSRIWNLQVDKSVAMCSRLGGAQGFNCAHGALMDYWLARAADGEKPPRDGPGGVASVCAFSSPRIVQLCWFRATWDLHLTGPGIHTRRYARRLCSGLDGPAGRGCAEAVALMAG